MGFPRYRLRRSKEVGRNGSRKEEEKLKKKHNFIICSKIHRNVYKLNLKSSEISLNLS